MSETTLPPYGHLIIGRYVDENGSAFLQLTSHRFKQHVRFDRDTSLNREEQMLQRLIDNGHEPIAMAAEAGTYYFICKNYKPFTP